MLLQHESTETRLGFCEKTVKHGDEIDGCWRNLALANCHDSCLQGQVW